MTAPGSSDLVEGTQVFTGLSLGTMTFSSNTCITALAAGASCTAIGRLSATTPGPVSFEVTTIAIPGGTAALCGEISRRRR